MPYYGFIDESNVYFRDLLRSEVQSTLEWTLPLISDDYLLASKPYCLMMALTLLSNDCRAADPAPHASRPSELTRSDSKSP